MSPETGSVASPDTVSATAPLPSPQLAHPAASGELAPAHTSGHTCANCGAPVLDNYCGRCGQRLEHELHSVWDFTKEATEDLTHADSRLWRTILALLFKPGFLTREFLSGRRVRYLPPLRLYLVLSVLFFLIVGSTRDEVRVVQISTGRSAAPGVAVERLNEFAERNAAPDETPQQRVDRLCRDANYDGPFQSRIKPLVMKSCRIVMQDNGRTLSEAFIHNLPRAMFVFLPLLALFMKLMYWRPSRYYVEHLLFFVHNHAFAFLIFGLLVLLRQVLPHALSSFLTVLVWLYVPIYLFRSMRRVYGQGRLLTSVKLIGLTFAYAAGALLMVALTAMYSVFSL